MCKIMISASTRARISANGDGALPAGMSGFHARPLDYVAVKGRKQAVVVHEVRSALACHTRNRLINHSEVTIAVLEVRGRCGRSAPAAARDAAAAAAAAAADSSSRSASERTAALAPGIVREAAVCDLHTRAVEAYLQRDFEAASDMFQRVIEMQAPDEDMAAQLLRERCEFLGSNPPEDNWDGSEVLSQKTW
jgi:hypothetical protein